MSFEFKETDIRKLSQVLGVLPKHRGSNYRFEIEQKSLNRKLALEIYPNIHIGKRKGNLISIYTPTAHLQLHFCTGYVVSKLLGEITFVAESSGKLSGLTVEREGGCSLYANVDREILSGDFTTLGPEVMLSGIALSLTESVLPRSVSANDAKIPQPVKQGKSKRKLKPKIG
ncbi:MAG: hypothetical protein HY276_12740 [Ignavibacteriales bacterium]|nr:hypothetical protein [Ignavibacteriales bacterium]MBI3789108.1 hypothetical protein [Ignavibacteriales bacterium]